MCIHAVEQFPIHGTDRVAGASGIHSAAPRFFFSVRREKMCGLRDSRLRGALSMIGFGHLEWHFLPLPRASSTHSHHCRPSWRASASTSFGISRVIGVERAGWRSAHAAFDGEALPGSEMRAKAGSRHAVHRESEDQILNPCPRMRIVGQAIGMRKSAILFDVLAG